MASAGEGESVNPFTFIGRLLWATMIIVVVWCLMVMVPVWMLRMLIGLVGWLHGDGSGKWWKGRC